MPGPGRPSIYSEELAEQIALAIEGSTMGLSAVCRAHKEFPDPATAWRWMHDKSGFRDRIQRAKEVQADSIVSEGVEILDEVEVENVDPRIASAAVQLAKARAEYRLKIAPKIAPRTMGDRTALDIGGQAKAPPIPVEQRLTVDDMLEVLDMVREATVARGE